MPEQIFDSIASVYDNTRKLPPEIMVPLVDKLAELLAGKSLLDVGIGTGRFSVPLSQKGINVTGIDLSTGMLDKCRQKGFDRTVLANGCNMPFGQGRFHNAFMTHVLHLVEDWPCLLREVCRVTSGSLFCAISLWPRDDDWPGHYYGQRSHELGYSSKAGIFERELAERIEPDERIFIGMISESKSNDAYIQLLENRQLSSAKRLPGNIHEMLVREVKERFAGITRTVEARVEIVRWDIGNLSQFLLNMDE